MTDGPDAATVLKALERDYVVAVLRAPDAERARTAIAALITGGVTAVEVAYTTPEATDVIDWVRTEHPEIVVGAGTVRTQQQVQDAAAAGAAFLVSPGLDAAVAGAMIDSGRMCAVGALSPTEVMAVAAYSGIPVVKLFPGSLGGPAYLRALRGPFPELRFMPTGGVAPESIRSWMEAGAAAVGAGGELCPSSAIATGDSAEIQRRARLFLTAVRSARDSRTTSHS
ncbi:bifunctional 4-hydroxy-2-oxoglutarate aldolase/2-dehydro-3-deoxy-phosphogluconate aldolase [Mumia qirimensis]|uniref:bifunctional 4-hydroxy-2-oxoglutarate aldolase/2-dehydro-3-deoxy-phosphogluconate aldolase n=1 Tax=Mumia qirimensis TaxID=3234852 RepID=UPI00351CBC9F